jgi:plastocyanin
VPDSQSLAVGEGTGITATYGGATLTGFADAALVPATISDSSIISGSAFSVRALAVGSASITATYNGSTTMVTFSVHPTADGVSAAIFMNENPNTTTSAWLPGTTHVQTGATIEFYPEVSHNVTFDAVPGAPHNIAVNTDIATRIFSTPGTFPYHCTLHGEAGTVIVSP